MKRSDLNPDRLLATFDEDVRVEMESLDRLISEIFAGRSRTVWEGVFWGGTEQRIIGYGDIVQPRPRGEDVEWFAVGLARQSKHYSIYVNAVDDGAYLLAQYEGRLGRAKLGSASVTFADPSTLDRTALRELLERAERLTR